MKIVFMGTPDFSVPALISLINAGHNIAGVFTQPDKPKNRGHQVQCTPVKEEALSRSIDVFQPISLRKGDDADTAYSILTKLNPDVIVVVAYGQFLPEKILNLPKYGCINIHASLLPKYRGAAPIQWSIINGEKVTGITTMYMAKGIDTGDMILKSQVEITEDMTASVLHDLLSESGAELIVKTLDMIEKGIAPRIPQQNEDNSYASLITKEMCQIDFTRPAADVYNFIRGMSSSPCAYTFIDGKRLKVYMAHLGENIFNDLAGTIVNTNKFEIVCGDKNTVLLTEIQPENGKKMSAESFLCGYKLKSNSILEK